MNPNMAEWVNNYHTSLLRFALSNPFVEATVWNRHLVLSHKQTHLRLICWSRCGLLDLLLDTANMSFCVS